MPGRERSKLNNRQRVHLPRRNWNVRERARCQKGTQVTFAKVLSWILLLLLQQTKKRDTRVILLLVLLPKSIFVGQPANKNKHVPKLNKKL